MKFCCKIKLLRKFISSSKSQCRFCGVNHYYMKAEFGRFGILFGGK